jgi:nitrogen fixation NifU-like protein
LNALDEHFRSPRNAGVLDDADLRIEVDNPICGDVLRLTLRRASDGLIEDVRFQAYGCPAAVAVGSLLTELLRGKSRDELLDIDKTSVDRALGGLSSEKAHAAVLAQDAIQRLRDNW